MVCTLSRRATKVSSHCISKRCIQQPCKRYHMVYYPLPKSFVRNVIYLKPFIMMILTVIHIILRKDAAGTPMTALVSNRLPSTYDYACAAQDTSSKNLVYDCNHYRMEPLYTMKPFGPRCLQLTFFHLEILKLHISPTTYAVVKNVFIRFILYLMILLTSWVLLYTAVSGPRFWYKFDTAIPFIFYFIHSFSTLRMLLTCFHLFCLRRHSGMNRTACK